MNSDIGENQRCCKSRVFDSIALVCHVRVTNPLEKAAKRFPGTGSRTINALPETRGMVKIKSPSVQKRAVNYSGLIPCELLRKGRHRHRSGSQRTCPCQLLPCHSPWRLPMRDIRSRRFHIRYTYRCQQQLPIHSLHGYGFRGADIDTGLAVNAHVLVNFCLIIIEGDCRCGTFAHAGFASGTLIVVNNCYQLVHSIVYVSVKRKKRVSITTCPSGCGEN